MAISQITSNSIATGAVSASDLADGIATQWTTSGANISYSSGNVGIGVTPSAWGSSYRAMQLGPQLSLSNDSGGAGVCSFGANYYRDSGGSFRYIANGFVSRLSHSDGAFVFSNAPSGTAGNTVTLTDRMTLDASGNLQFNSGYGSVATAYGCRAWVNFNGQGTVAIRASGNVSSISDNGVGNYVVNFVTAMPNTSYAVTASFQRVDETGQFTNIGFGNGTGGFNIETFRAASNTNTAVLADFATVSLAVFR